MVEIGYTTACQGFVYEPEASVPGGLLFDNKCESMVKLSQILTALSKNRVSQNTLALFFTLIVLTLCLATVIFVWPENSVYGKDTGLRFLQLLNFRRGSFAIQYPGYSLDPELSFAPYDPAVLINREIYIFITPLLPLLSVPFYTLFGYAGIYVVPILGALGASFVTYKIAQEIEIRSPAPLILILSMATPVLFYALSFWDHTLALFLAGLGLLLLVRALKHDNTLYALASGGAFGVGVWNRYELYAFSAAAFLGFLLTHPKERQLLRHFGVWGIGFSLAVIPLWIFNTILYHHPFGPSIGFRFSNIIPLLEFRSAVITFPGSAVSVPLWQRMITVIATHWVGGIPTRAMSISFGLSFGFLALVLRARALRSRTVILLSAVGLFIATDIALLLSSEFLLTGLLTTTPFLVMFFAYRSHGVNVVQNRIVSALVLTFLLFVVLGALTALSTGGPQWGPRYLLPAYIPLTLVAVHVMEQQYDELSALKRPIYSIVWSALLVMSLATQVKGLTAQYHLRQSRQFAHELIPQLPVEVIVSDGYQFLIEMAAYHYDYDKKFLFVEDEQEYNQLLETLEVHAIDTYAYFSLVEGNVSPTAKLEQFRVVPIDPPIYTFQRLESTYRRQYQPRRGLVLMEKENQ